MKQKMSRLGILGIALLGVSACERIPEIERRTSLGKASENSRHLIELKKWLWTCRGFPSSANMSRASKDLGDKIEEFIDHFHSKGLSSISSEESSQLLGTAILWRNSGFLLAPLRGFEDSKNIECSNGILPWASASLRGFDRSLDLAVLKLDPSVLPSLKAYLRWGMRTDLVGVDEILSILSTAYPGQVDRFSVQLQPFQSTMRTGIDEDLLLFLPPAPAISSGGVLVDSTYKVVGYLLPYQSELWGTAIHFRKADLVVSSIIDKGRIQQAYMGLKVRFHDGVFSVQQIEVGSPAYRAGLRLDDIVLKWNRLPLSKLTDWQELSPSDIGKTIEVTYKRGEKIIEGEIRPTKLE